MAQRDQVTGPLGTLNAGNACNAQHVAFFGVAFCNQGQGRGQHLDASTGNGNTMGGRLAGHVDHMGLASGVKMGKCGHE